MSMRDDAEKAYQEEQRRKRAEITKDTQIEFEKRFALYYADLAEYDGCYATVDNDLRFIRIGTDWALAQNCPQCGQECISRLVKGLVDIGEVLAADWPVAFGHLVCPDKIKIEIRQGGFAPIYK